MARGSRAGAQTNIVRRSGAKPMVFYAPPAVLEAGAKCSCPTRCRSPVVVPLRGGFRPLPADAVGRVNAELLAPLIGRALARLVVNLPGKSHGGVATTDALHAIAELELRHDLVVILGRGVRPDPVMTGCGQHRGVPGMLEAPSS